MGTCENMRGKLLTALRRRSAAVLAAIATSASIASGSYRACPAVERRDRRGSSRSERVRIKLQCASKGHAGTALARLALARLYLGALHCQRRQAQGAMSHRVLNQQPEQPNAPPARFAQGAWTGSVKRQWEEGRSRAAALEDAYLY